jgi:hypothetical protein
MKHTVRLIALSLATAWLAACAPASEEVEVTLDTPEQPAQAAATARAEAVLRSVAMAESGMAEKPVVHVWKSPTCGCCALWVEHLKAAGYPVEVEDVADINAVKRARGIPVRAWSCHTAEVDGYLVEGHVPAATIDRVLAEHPEVAGVAVPGMPMGSPGMEMPGMEPQPYEVVTFTRQGQLELYEQH